MANAAGRPNSSGAGAAANVGPVEDAGLITSPGSAERSDSLNTFRRAKTEDADVRPHRRAYIARRAWLDDMVNSARRNLSTLLP